MRFFCSGASSSSSNGPSLAPAQWSQMGILHEHTLRAMMYDFGYQNLTDVQRQVLPACLDFSPQGLDRDILVRARTGTGKTLTFLVSMVERIVRQPDASAGILGMVLSPTRELAMQICGELDKLLSYHAMQSVPCIGGCSREADVRAIRQRRTFSISNVKFQVGIETRSR